MSAIQRYLNNLFKISLVSSIVYLDFKPHCYISSKLLKLKYVQGAGSVEVNFSNCLHLLTIVNHK